MEKIIRFVAIYLRKSRGDDETALDKHKHVLIELCIKNNWKYVIFEEIMSGDSIAMRPIFSRLLEDIKSGIYDGVVVMDIDRLGRGNQADQGLINQAFASTDTYIITPQQIYNLNNDSDEMIVDIRSFVSRQEYKQIVKRLSQGKKIGARLGNWTNGIPPYGYAYERYGKKHNPKGLVINDEEYKIYRLMLDSMLKNNMSPKEIATMLNKMNVPAPRGAYWHGNTVHRLLVDETHLGKIISNKTKGDGHAVKKPSVKNLVAIPRENWVIVENCHESIKTQEEHNGVLLFLARQTKAPRRTQQEIMPLSGLVECKKCGHTMGVYKRSDRKSQYVLKPCWYVDELGNKCGNRGMKTDPLIAFVKNDAKEYLERLKKESTEIDINENKLMLEQQINTLRTDIDNKNKSLDRILEAFENGLYTLDQFKERKIKVEKAISQAQSQISLLELEYNQYNSMNIEEKIRKLEYFINHIDDDTLTDVDKNKLYKTVIERIIWERNGDDMKVRIKYIKY